MVASTASERTLLISQGDSETYNVDDNPEGSQSTSPTATRSLSLTLDSSDRGEDDDSTERHPVGRATVAQTALNMAKTCMGTGTLALPFAASQGGYLFSTLGLAAIACWNYYCIDRLVRCAELLPTGEGVSGRAVVRADGSGSVQRERKSLSNSCTPRNSCRVDRTRIDGLYEEIEEISPPAGISKFGRVAWYSCGPRGLHFFDGIMMILLFGIIIAYEDAALSFIARTPFTTGSTKLDAVGVVFAITPITCVPDVGFLNKFSAVGILAIFLAFAVIFGYGLSGRNVESPSVVSDVESITWNSLWPENATGIANWYGVCVFSFGTVPLTYNFQDSMAKPHLMHKATEVSLWIVFATYVVISNGVAILYSPTAHSFEGDVLQHLPNSWIATCTRLIMTFVVIVTAPLLVVPCSEIIEGKLGLGIGSSYMWKIAVRVGICSLSTGISVLVPGFVLVISLIGCCCVALVSFALPPLFYILLVLKERKNNHIPERVDAEQFAANGYETSNHLGEATKRKTGHALRLDFSMLAWGVFSTVTSSYLTLMNVINEARSGPVEN